MSVREDRDAEDTRKHRERLEAIRKQVEAIDQVEAAEAAAEQAENSTPSPGKAHEKGSNEPPPQPGEESWLVPVAEGDPTRMETFIKGTPEKSWMRNGRQFRPMKPCEIQAEQDERLDKQALAKWQSYCDLVQKDIDLGEAEARQRLKRQRDEIRTGRREKPVESISLEEAARRGLIGGGGSRVDNKGQIDDSWHNPYANKRGRPDRFGGE